MRRLRMSHAATFGCLVVVIVLSTAMAHAQTDSATVSGRVADPSGLSVGGAQVSLVDIDRGISTTVSTNTVGLYTFRGVHPGRYRMEVAAKGFKIVNITGLTVNTQANLEQNFALSLGSVSESITVEAKAAEISTSVSTVVDRQFVENLPLNGRSFQSLIDLTPGTVLTGATPSDPGQFSVNGQRATANYFSVDGVSANIGISSTGTGPLSQSAAGALPGFTAQGGTNSLVSADALQEFRVQTSSYAPEFGRTPGAQISIETRSGSNHLHGTLFDYLRNDALDANDWFANNANLPRARERQNDFGGVLGGPILKDRAFFFFSYEGLRLRLPRTGITTVPSLAARQSAPAPMQPFLNAYPLPNGPDILDSAGNPTGEAPFNGSFSDPSSLNATSLRIDYNFTSNVSVFGRYNFAPSESLTRGPGTSLSTVLSSHIQTQTLTLGSTWAITRDMLNDARFNYSRNAGSSSLVADSFGGAVVPQDSALFPAGFSSRNSFFQFIPLDLQGPAWEKGETGDNLQRQFNIIDSFSLQKRSHTLKFGVDFRRLSPVFGPPAYQQTALFPSISSTVAASPLAVIVSAARGSTILFTNLGAYAQDTFKVTPRLTATYGIRWDVDFAPSTSKGPALLAVSGFDNPSTLSFAPPGTPIFQTRHGNFAPRLGLAYQLFSAQGRELVLRGGAGLFYDLASTQVSDAVAGGLFPFGGTNVLIAPGVFPIDPASAQPPQISAASLAGGALVAFDPHLKLPHTTQWNIALEQSLGAQRVLKATYVGAAGDDLIQYRSGIGLSPLALITLLVANSATSSYNALQVQYDGRLFRRLHTLASYTWAHSIDTASTSSASTSNTLIGSPNVNRGPSDFDVRHAASGAITYDIPSSWASNPVLHAIVNDWSIDNIFQIRSALPVEVFDSRLLFPTSLGDVRPDIIPGVPLYLADPSVAAGKRINRAAFAQPPVDSLTGIPLRQGTLGRNALRGFGAAQWDFSVRRRFAIHESLAMQVVAEFFNLLNHPSFANPVGDLSSPLFGTSVQMLGRGLGDPLTGSGLSPLYQVGGPRSAQVAIKLEF